MSVRKTRRSRRSQLSKYDLLLAVLPVPVFLGAFASSLTPIPQAVGVGVGGIPSACLLAYALFVAGPTASRPS